MHSPRGPQISNKVPIHHGPQAHYLRRVTPMRNGTTAPLTPQFIGLAVAGGEIPKPISSPIMVRRVAQLTLRQPRIGGVKILTRKVNQRFTSISAIQTGLWRS